MSKQSFADNQAKILFDYWDDSIKQFIVGGPANSNEAQTIHNRFPDIKCIGFEPNPHFVFEQNGELKFPGKVHEYALWSEDTELTLMTPEKATARSSSVCRPKHAPDMQGEYGPGIGYPVKARSLDSLANEFGLFQATALWIDIEYAEIPCLKGATELLSNGFIKLINLETFSHLYLPEINRILTGHGFMLQKIWNIGTDSRRDAQDVIYKLEK